MRSAVSGISYSDLNDYDLVLACQKKIEAAFNVLYKRYLRYTYGVLHRLSPDLAQGHDDIVQKVFIRVWKCIDKLQNPRAVMSIDEPLKGTDGDHNACHEIADTSALPDEKLERNEIIVQVNAALEQLPPHSKNVIVLREFYGLSYEEIAHCTKTEIGTVKSRIARAKTKMQSHLKVLNWYPSGE